MLHKELRINTQFSEDSDAVIIHDNILNFIKSLPDDFFTLIITSPPYNIGKSYEKGK